MYGGGRGGMVESFSFFIFFFLFQSKDIVNRKHTIFYLRP